jgi:acylpyruvate hydrolase
MKIICIGRNYSLHAKELGNDIPEEPIFFLKPDSSLILNNKPFFLPDFSEDIHHELELVIKIDRLGKHIQPEFARRYYSQVALGIDFTARDIQKKCKEQGLPWEKAKAFDGSAPLSRFLKLTELGGLENLHYELKVNGELRQSGEPSHMLFHVDHLISYLSKYMTLKIGDLIYTGTPAGVGKVEKNDRLEARLNGEKLIDMLVK